MADGGLGEAEPVARRRKTSQVPDREKDPQEVEVEAGAIRLAHDGDYNYEFDLDQIRENDGQIRSNEASGEVWRRCKTTSESQPRLGRRQRSERYCLCAISLQRSPRGVTSLTAFRMSRVTSSAAGCAPVSSEGRRP